MRDDKDLSEWLFQEILRQATVDFEILCRKKARIPRKVKKKFKKLISTL